MNEITQSDKAVVESVYKKATLSRKPNNGQTELWYLSL